ncbi:hypothetical protein SNE25_07995 [Mucilaginibacter sabulilitoris]|uniref:Uncharacterized protein n=1 Tax=Mucilaginibacter sabulilitoris TaxID=1173583 RepID=A0ABZ0TTQ7_9SPHI|nr:hypothetical protein [Mucilaginibacter sabulilitoris]WPU95463.1 hypothetical protein SNE25_07995 [Mucilaginibacter sabulilitoris]
MIEKYVKGKSLIFDGSQAEILNRAFDPDIKVDIEGAITFNDFANNNFEDLRQIIDGHDFETIVSTGNFTTDGGFLNLYRGSDNLRLYFCTRNNIVIVFAFGEFQPTRYKLYIEGAWVIGS